MSELLTEYDYQMSLLERENEYKGNKINKLCGVILKVYSRAASGGVGVQMITSYKCLRCDGDFTHENTAVPLFCKKCLKIIRQSMKEPKEQE